MQLPKLQVKANVTEERKLLRTAKAWLEQEERTPGIHVSDLLSPLYAYWERITPSTLSPRKVTTFLVGKVLHAFILSAVDKSHGVDWASDQGSKTHKETGIEYSMDHCLDKIPTEIKTSRSYYAPSSLKDLETYLEQVLCYMVLEKSLSGKLWVLYLNLKDKDKRTHPQFRCFDVTVGKKELKMYEQQMLDVKANLETAIKKKNPSKLPLCTAWKCGETMCDHWDECKPKGRYGVPERKWK